MLMRRLSSGLSKKLTGGILRWLNILMQKEDIEMKMKVKKNQKVVSRAIEIVSDDKKLRISFDGNGIPAITLSDGDSALEFQPTEAQTNIIRLFFWDNYRRRNIWQTKAQRKKEGLIQTVYPDELIIETIEFPSNLDFGIDHIK